MPDPALAASAFMLGLAGSGHCLGMCGGIAASVNLTGQRTAAFTLAYHAGRILSYTLLGGLLGLAAGSIENTAWTTGLRYLAGLMLIGMGLYVANWWRGMALLERLGAIVWKPVQHLSRRWLPIQHWHQALGLGLCWGLLPCGLIYSSLAWSATAQNALYSAQLMFLFGLGTLPAMLAASLGASQLREILRKRGLQLGIALLLIGSGVWSLYSTYGHSAHAGHTVHTTTPSHQQPMTHH